MNQPPIYVVAATHRIAENFIRTDLQENPRRLRFISEPDRLQGLEYVFLYLHPTAPELLHYGLILEMARRRGCTIVQVDDYYARLRRGKGLS